MLEKYAFFYILIRFGAICSLRASGEDMEIIFQRFPSQAKKKQRKFRFQKKDIGIIFQRFPSQAKNKKTRKSRFQIEYIGIIFQRLPSQAQKATEILFSKRRFWHYFPKAPITSQKKPPKSRFHMKFSSQAKKATEIPFSNRRYWHYFPKVSLTSLKNHGKHGKLVFK